MLYSLQEIFRGKLNMSEIPSSVKNSTLWTILKRDEELVHTLVQLRNITEIISNEIPHYVPEITDHSVKHMDALWNITDIVFTKKEIETFTIGEAFILACSFYVHDLGMAYCFDKTQLHELESSLVYKGIYEKLCRSNVAHNKAKRSALQILTRQIHASKSCEMIQTEIPVLKRYLIESSDMRHKWSEHIGIVSLSHSWTINILDQKIGQRGEIPVPQGKADLGFVACALRVIDFAHINYERASILDKLIRQDISEDSLIHWIAQENISGPIREENKLKYSTNKAIDDVDGWWKFYELASGLNKEISTVYEYLETRTKSKGRFSLVGVKGIDYPEDFAKYVQTKNFEPIDVHFRTGSIEKLINLLGGKELYGEDYTVPIREIIQNSNDAIKLYRIQYDDPTHGEIIVRNELEGNDTYLTIIDNGIGMSKNTITKYLLGIASDYWNSNDFIYDFPKAIKNKFRPVGKFGIGFLSVFMISTDIEVETEKIGSQRFRLNIKGLGRHGALQTIENTGIHGTKVRIKLHQDVIKHYTNLKNIVLARAPMLDIPIKVSKDNSKQETIFPKWWQAIDQEGFFSYSINHSFITSPQQQARNNPRRMHYYFRDSKIDALSKIDGLDKWQDKQPEVISDSYRIIALPKANAVLICSNGFAVETIPISGITGIVDIGDIDLNTSRSTPIQWDINRFRIKIVDELQKHMINSLNALNQEPNIPARFNFLADVGQVYGNEVLIKTSLKWITIIRPPGDIIQISAEELLNIIPDYNELFITYDCSPWKSYSLLRTRFNRLKIDNLIIPISSVGQPSPGSYHDRDEIIECPLEQHFENSYFGQGNEVNQATMLLSILEITAKAWNINQTLLFSQKWNRKEQTLCGHLKRP